MCVRVYNRDTGVFAESPSELRAMLGVTELVPAFRYKTIRDDACLCQVDCKATCEMTGYQYAIIGNDPLNAHIEKPKLHLHVNSVYFNQIKAREKREEYRRVTDYWIKRLIDLETGKKRQFFGVTIYNAYKPGPENVLRFKWLEWTIKEITHPHFGTEPVMVFSIHLS